MKVRELIAILEANGFALDRQRGDHRQYEAVIDGKRRVVTVSGKLGDDVQRNNLGSVRRQSGLPRRSFR